VSAEAVVVEYPVRKRRRPQSLGDEVETGVWCEPGVLVTSENTMGCATARVRISGNYVQYAR